MSARPKILLTTEGTYPCYRGGVSVWCHQLIRHLREHEFHVFAVVHAPSQPLLFNLPENVASCRTLPLWGTEEPGGAEGPFSESFQRKLATTTAAIRRGFTVPFADAVRAFVKPGRPSEELATALGVLHEYFRHHDYARTMASPEAWDTFRRACAEAQPPHERLNLEEATQCMRWLRRYLAVLSIPYPATDVVHASMAGLAAIPGVLGKLSRGSRFLVTEHGIHLRELYLHLSGTDYSERGRRFLVTLNTAIVKMHYRYADAITTLCEFNRRWQVEIGAEPSKIFLVSNGVDPLLFHPRPHATPTRPTVLTMARVFPLKGIDVLLDAAARVRAALPDVLFRIMGDVADADYFDRCQKLIRYHHLEASVEFSQTGDPGIYSQAHVFCLPSLSEGVPYSVLEAMFSGCPVVATAVGGVAEILGDTGVLVKPSSPAALSSAILGLLAPGAIGEQRRRSLALAALRRARSRYALSQCIRRMDDLYAQLLLGQAETPRSALGEPQHATSAP